MVILNHGEPAIAQLLPQVNGNFGISCRAAVNPAKRRALWTRVDEGASIYQEFGVSSPSAVSSAVQRCTKAESTGVQVGLMLE